MNTPPKTPIAFYSEEELDALEQENPRLAARIAQAQARAEREAKKRKPDPANMPNPDAEAVAEAMDTVRNILRRDGGDIELVEIKEHVVWVRMKGACVGCPNSVLDLQNVVSHIVCAVPGVAEVRNTF